MSYDVRDFALALLQDAKAEAERECLSAEADAKGKKNAFLSAKAVALKLQNAVDKQAAMLSRFKGKRRTELRERRAALREKRRELADAKKELRKRRYAYSEADSKLNRCASRLSKVGGVYTQVERTWIPGCVVRSKPVFDNLIPKD